MKGNLILYPWLRASFPLRALFLEHQQLLEKIEQRCTLINLHGNHLAPTGTDIYSARIRFISSCLRLSAHHHEIDDIKMMYSQTLVKKRTLLKKLKVPFYFCRAYQEIYQLFGPIDYTSWRTNIAKLNQIILGKVSKTHAQEAKLRTRHQWFGVQPAVQPIYCEELLENLYQQIFTARDWRDSNMRNPLLLGLLTHIYFLLILPFEEGNMRLANLLQYSIYRSAGMSEIVAAIPITFFADQAPSYYSQLPDILRSSGNYSQFIKFALNGILGYANETLLRLGTRHLCQSSTIDLSTVAC